MKMSDSDAAANDMMVRGIPLADEQGLGALTLGAFLREVTNRFPDNEAAVFHNGSEVVRWTYADLWQKAQGVAKALAASGLGKGERVGILMTNRPEFLSAVFGTALAGGSYDDAQHLLNAIRARDTAGELGVLYRSARATRPEKGLWRNAL